MRGIIVVLKYTMYLFTFLVNIIFTKMTATLARSGVIIVDDKFRNSVNFRQKTCLFWFTKCAHFQVFKRSFTGVIS